MSIEELLRKPADTALEALRECNANGDIEMAHMNADAALCAFLRELGHDDVAEAFEEVEKWYA